MVLKIPDKKLQPHADVATSVSLRIFKQWHCGGINDSVS